MDSNFPRPLDVALRPGGLYYTTDGTAVDAHGNVLSNAPDRPKDTPENEQPYARMIAMTSVGASGMPASAGGMDVELLGRAIGDALLRGTAQASASREAAQTSADAQSSLVEGAASATPDASGARVIDSSRASADAGTKPADAPADDSGKK